MALMNKLSTMHRLLLWLAGYSLLVCGFIIYQYNGGREVSAVAVWVAGVVVMLFLLQILRLYRRLQRANAERDREHHAALYQLREQERIKKRLTNNINHELKTPVASVKICTETLLAHPDMSDAKREEFLRRILANADRLSRLLADVALITRMEDGGEAIAREPLDLAEVIADVVADRRPVAASRGIEIGNAIADPLPLTGNRSLLESVFNNLIDNAIAHSGCSRVMIRRLKSDSGDVMIELADDGCGVADEHLPRLFERFYRIDKGRSRAAGGTGLGLAIVKNAVAFHGGTIVASNSPRGGLRFLMTFPGIS